MWRDPGSQPSAPRHRVLLVDIADSAALQVLDESDAAQVADIAVVEACCSVTGATVNASDGLRVYVNPKSFYRHVRTDGSLLCTAQVYSCALGGGHHHGCDADKQPPREPGAGVLCGCDFAQMRTGAPATAEIQ